MTPARALTIAGSDSGGGAGIQADLKTFAALRVYGTCAITAVTAQDTRGVSAVAELAPGMVAAQIDAALDDIGADAAKTGMLATAAIIEAVAERLRAHRVARLVVDPVMVAKSGDRLLRPDAVAALREMLLPLALIVTPNIPEAETLAGIPLAEPLARAVDEGETAPRLEEAARRIADRGARYVLIKGGHLPGPPVDHLWDGERLQVFPGDRVATANTHGTGCTLSAAITALLSRGTELQKAVAQAKLYVTGAMRHAQPIGHGHGPLHHFWDYERQSTTV
jgi:hydroxymethylpyrimidine/phosphomethylpyrimidine kinase